MEKIQSVTEFFCNFAVCKKRKNDKTTMIKRNALNLLPAMAVMLLSLSVLFSCNKKDKDDDDIYHYSTSEQTTLVTGFALQADGNVLASLDSVHFTIDYDKGLIYNADSLPVGTNITALKVTVNFLSTVNSAVFNISGATKQADTTITYSASMTKSLDFTGKTVLTVTSYDKSQVKDYEVKVLVHKVNPDSLVWPMDWRRDLPESANARSYKTVKQGGLYRAMAYDGLNCTLLTATAPNQGTWEKQTVDLQFHPRVNTLVASDEALYMLDEDGVLYTSPEGLEWTTCGVIWHSLIGVYEDRVLGIVSGADGYYHDEFPRPEGFDATAVEDGFPIEHSSDMIVTDNNWTVAQQAIIVGGVDRNGQLLSNVWGYDGKHWGKVNNYSSSLPAIADATLFPYYTFTSLSGVRRSRIQPTWFLMGGKLADGNLNKRIYLSTTQGITWKAGNDSTLAQAGHIPPFYGAQGFVLTETLSTNGASNMPRRISSIDGTWDCPFIYLFGGYNSEGELLPYIWRGVYIRMINNPVY